LSTSSVENMKILFCGEEFPWAAPLLKKLLPEDEVLTAPKSEVHVRGLDVDALIPLMHRLEPELIARTTAKLIHQWGVGLEGVDIGAASARGIAVCNVPSNLTPNADATAEHAVFLMMGLARRIHECFKAFQKGMWGAPLGESLSDSKALIVGLGNVGKALARKLTALGMNVEAIRRTAILSGEGEPGIARTGGLPDLLDMAATADFVISTVVLNDQTHGLFNRALFHVMKPTAFVVNVSRGPVVNEQDLLLALEEGTIAGAGLDVYAEEPLSPDHPFLKTDKVLATPHVAGVTRQNYEGICRVMVENILLFKEGKLPRTCVNAHRIVRANSP
jgi:phosphoglycerate dehydrogenase-like enzyme